MDYVAAVLADAVRVRCASGPLAARVLARGATACDRGVEFAFDSRPALAAVLEQLQRLQLPFADAPAGWPPAAVFAQLRDEGLVHGRIIAVSWNAPDQPVLRDA